MKSMHLQEALNATLRGPTFVTGAFINSAPLLVGCPRPRGAVSSPFETQHAPSRWRVSSRRSRAAVVIPRASLSAPVTRDRGTFLLVATNALMFALSAVPGAPALSGLYLNHSFFRPWQLVTSLFLHGSFSHLSGNLFFLLVFGKLVEEKGGTAGVILTYLITGIFANLASLALMPSNVVSLGASGAVFGLFAVSVLARIEWNVKSLLETAILGNFVVNRVLEESAQTLARNGSRALVQTNHIAHLGGALGGVVLVLLLNAVASAGEAKE